MPLGLGACGTCPVPGTSAAQRVRWVSSLKPGLCGGISQRGQVPQFPYLGSGNHAQPLGSQQNGQKWLSAQCLVTEH